MAGAGDNQITVTTYMEKGTVMAGDGADLVSIESAQKSLINLGAGRNTLLAENTLNDGNTLTAGSGSDLIRAGGDNNFISAGSGKNSITLGGGQNNTLVTGAGNDTITLGENASGNVIVFGGGKDLVINYGSSDTVAATTSLTASTVGSDVVLTNGTNRMTLQGAADKFINTETITSSSDAYKALAEDKTVGDTLAPDGIVDTTPPDTVSPTTPAALNVNSSVDATLIAGTAYDDTIQNSGSNVTIDGGTGYDSIWNSGVEVSISGDKGDDTIGNDGANVTIDGSAGDDYLVNSGAGASIFSGKGDDSIINDGANVTTDGGAGDDEISLNSSASLNVIEYRAGNGFDTVYGFNATSTLNLSGDEYSTQKSGDDIIVTVGDGKITLRGAASLSAVNIDGKESTPATPAPEDSTIVNTVSGALVTGTEDNDIIENNGANATIQALGGDDSISNALRSKVKILGGDGNDSVSNQGARVTVDGGTGSDYVLNVGKKASIVGGADDDDINNYGANATLSGGTGNDAIRNWEGDEGYGSNVLIVGGAGDDSVWNYNGANVLFKYAAGDGNDLIEGFNATSTLQLGDGSDTYSKAISGSDIVVTAGDGSIVLKDAAKLSTLNILGKEFSPVVIYDNKSASKVTLASSIEIGDATARTKAINITGNNLDNTIVGGSGKDTLYGKNGDDYLEGGDGADKLYGNGGNDTLWGGTGNDTLTGNAGSDLFIYTAGKDVIADFDDDDTLQLGDGSDTYSKAISGKNVVVTAGEGSITLKNAASLSTLNILGKESAPATIYDNKSASKVTLASSIGIGDATARTSAIRITGNNIANTILGGTGKDTLYGKNGDDYLEGGDGNDKLYGQNDDDTLWGGIGNDTLEGGKGADTFIYNDGEGKDVITDFGDDDLLQITGDFTTSYNASAGTITFKFDDGRLTLKDFTATTFNINGDSYHISGNKLVK